MAASAAGDRYRAPPGLDFNIASSIVLRTRFVGEFRAVTYMPRTLAAVLDGAMFEMHYQFQMLVCACHPTSDRDVDAVIDDGARTVEDIGRRCGAGTGCGSCLEELRDRLVAKGVNACPRDCANDLVSLRSR